MTLHEEIQELRNTIKHGSEEVFKDPDFWERVRGTLGRCAWYVDQATILQQPDSFAVEPAEYSLEADTRYAPTHIVTLRIPVYENEGFRELLNWLFQIDPEMWG